MLNFIKNKTFKDTILIVFIELFKTNQETGYKLFLLLKKANINEFKTNFLEPLLKYIESQLESTNDVSKFSRIY